MLRDKLTDELTIRNARGLEEEIVKRTRVRVGDSIAGWVALEGKRSSSRTSRMIDDQRESPALRIVELLRESGAEVASHDPHVPVCLGHRLYPDIDMKSTDLTEKALRKADVVLLITDHSAYDYDLIERHARCIVDTRGAFRKNGIKSGKVYRA